MSEQTADVRALGEPDTSRKPPKYVFIGGLAFLAFTTGITVALIPAFRRNRTRSTQVVEQAVASRKSASSGLASRAPAANTSAPQPPAGLDIFALGRDQDVPANSFAVDPPSLKSSASSPILSQLAPTAFNSASHAISQQQRVIDGHPQPLWLEEEETVDDGPGRGDDAPHDPAGAISPLFALGAFGIATALVAAAAGVAAVGIARAMDVRDMEEFAAAMRSKVSGWLPRMADALYHPDETAEAAIGTSGPSALLATNTSGSDAEESALGDEDIQVGEWLEEVLDKMEADRRELVKQRKLGGARQM